MPQAPRAQFFHRGRLLKVATVSALVLLTPRAEAADNGYGYVKWHIEVDGDACVRERATFEREIHLACGAMTTCRVSARREEAELVATLKCQDANWSLETRTASGMMLGTISLTGATDEDRMREAAMEIARDAAPERTLAAENLRNTLVAPSRNDRDRVTMAKSKNEKWENVEPDARVHVSASAFGSAGLESEVDGFGGRVMGAYRLTPVGHVTFSVVGAMSAGAKVDLAGWRRMQAGAGLGFGAPVDERKIFGLCAEVGVDGTQRYRRAESAVGGEDYWQARTSARGYARVATYMQIPVSKYFRPFLGLSGAYLSDQSVSAAGDVGMTFPLF